MGSPARVPVWADRVYTTLLRVYPASFREEYASEMRAAFRSRWREEHQARGLLGVARLWISVLLDTLATAAWSQGEELARDVRYAWRSLTGRPNWSFTSSALLTLALGIGAVTAIFSIVHTVLLAPLPYREPDRVVRLWETKLALDIDDFSVSMPNFRSWQEQARSFSHLAALRSFARNVTEGDEPERVDAAGVSADLWELLGMRPLAGRAFGPEEAGPKPPPVVMISEGLWKRRYGGEPSAIGRTIHVNLAPYLILGVVPQDVGFASNIDLWLPLGHEPEDDSRGDHRLDVLGRLAPGVSLQQAQAELLEVAARLDSEFPETNRGWRVRVAPVREWIVDAEVGQRLEILLAAVAMLLLVAATNVANLQIARSASRLREIGVRLALGASRARLVRQILTENLLLAAAGGAAGLALAWAGVRAAAALLPASIPRREALSLDPPVLLVAVLCVVLTALITGLLPARLVLRSNVQDALQQAGRTTTGGRSPARFALVAVQLALATTLVVGAALLTQSLVRLQRVAVGIGDPEHLLTTQITRSVTTDEMLGSNREFFTALVKEIRALPGVEAAGISNEVPFGDNTTEMPVSPIGGSPDLPEEGVQAQWRIVSADYFQTMQIPLRRGRTFEEGREPRHSMILSEGLGRRLWPDGRDPVGRRVVLGNGQTFTIVGLVGDVRQLNLREDPTPTMYMSTSWYLWPTMTLAVRTATEPDGHVRAIREAVARLDRHQPLSGFQTMRSAIAANAATPRLNTVLMATFAGLALILAIVGVAGVIGYSMTQRTRELAVRLALGATPGQVVRQVMRSGLAMCVVGVLGGTVAALALGRLLASVLYGVAAHDPLTIFGAACALLAAAAWACWLPARRATQTSLILTLREG